MSRGPGRIERGIVAMLDAEPDNAFTVEDFCQRIYGIDNVGKRHRVAVLRALAKLQKQRDTLSCLSSWQQGSCSIYFNAERVMSYAMARLKADSYYAPRISGLPFYYKSEDDLRACIRKGGDHYQYVIKGGIWWQYTQLNIAEIEALRTGDKKRLKQIEAERERTWAVAMGELGS
jgi:hypothetical protein